MEEFACLGILDPGGGKENVYDKLLATIDKKELTPNKITVKIVDALSKLVYVAKSKSDHGPTTMLSKRQFAHVLGYICNRDMRLEELSDKVIRNVWNLKKIEKQMASNPDVVWDGFKFLGFDTSQLDLDNKHGSGHQEQGEGSGEHVVSGDVVSEETPAGTFFPPSGTFASELSLFLIYHYSPSPPPQKKSSIRKHLAFGFFFI